jgi:NADPH2:quinone reductase
MVGAAWGPFVQKSPEVAHRIGEELDRMARIGALQPPVGTTFDLADTRQALAILQERKAVGKVVLDVSP